MVEPPPIRHPLRNSVIVLCIFIMGVMPFLVEVMTMEDRPGCFESREFYILLQEEMPLLRGAPLPLDRDQGLSGCGLLQHWVTEH